MNARDLFLIAMAVGGFGVFCVVLIDSIRWRYRRRQTVRELRQIGLEIDEDEAAWRRVRER